MLFYIFYLPVPKMQKWHQQGSTKKVRWKHKTAPEPKPPKKIMGQAAKILVRFLSCGQRFSAATLRKIRAFIVNFSEYAA